MENLVEKINLILKTKNISARQFAEEIGVQPSGMSHILSGRNNPSLDFVMKVVKRYPEIDIKWLMFGQGEMLVQNSTMPSAPMPSPQVKQASSTPVVPDLFSHVNENPVNEPVHDSHPEYAVPLQAENPIPNPATSVDQQIAKLSSVAASASKNKHIVRLLAFYDDHTFAEFLPEQ